MTFDLKFSTTLIYPLLLVLLAIIFTLLIYRTTTPPVTNWVRRGLAMLRTVSLALALLLLFEPVFTLGLQRRHKPTVAILVDRSASMSLTDSSIARADLVRRAMTQSWLKILEQRAETASFSFSDSLHRMNLDTLQQMRFTGDGSDLGGALLAAKKILAERPLAAAIMFTDGAQNMGESPLRVAEQFGVPIVTVGIGSAQGARDVLVSEILTNEIAYAETQLPIEVSVSSIGYAGRRARIRICEESSGASITDTTRKKIILHQQEITLPADNTQVTTRFDIIPHKLGLNRYLVQIDTLAGELTKVNNQRTVYVRVLKNKLKLWIIAGAPSPEYVFLKRTLEADRNFEIHGFVQRPNGNFYDLPVASMIAALTHSGRQDLEENLDGIIMIDFPRRDSERSLLEVLSQYLVKNNKPLFFISGPGVDLGALWQFRSVLPLAAAPAQTAERLVYLQPDLAALSHALTRFSETPEDNRRLWEELPPVFGNLANLQPLAGSQVLAFIDSPNSPVNQSRKIEVFLAQKSAERKTVAIFVYGLWRWHLLMQGVGKTPLVYETLVRNAVRWMVATEDAKLVRITSNKEIYRGGESIELAAQIYYEDYRPREGVQVRVQLFGPQFSEEVILQDVGGGLYRATLQVLGGGEYQFQGIAEQNGQKIGEDGGRFSVEPFSLEFLNTRLNETLLRQMAQASGGYYGPPDSLASFVTRLPMTPTLSHETLDFALWGRAPVLLVLLLVLGVEWFVRKRQGML
ncbi:MAG: VWA domain-containing protein [candidate division KSB1 bacterium]|nr:VWA domain-containing protein [candidate division KSB1 bacterium]